jgi:tetratricopeptide (TPR) repeat protein
MSSELSSEDEPRTSSSSSSSSSSSPAPPDDLLGAELDLGKLREKYADLPAPSARLASARASKDAGGACFGRKDWAGAAEAYSAAARGLENEWDFTATDAREAKELRVVCHSNAAQCRIRLKSYFEARAACDAALAIDDEHAKTLYRRGLANAHLAAFDSAKRDFGRALALDPDNKFVKKELKRLEARVDKHRKKEKRVYEKAFQKMDGVFSEHREGLEEFEKPGAGAFARWFGWVGKVVERHCGHAWPWLGVGMPLAVVVGRFLGRPLGVGTTLSSRVVCSCLFLLGGVLQLRWSQRKQHWLPGWLGDGVQSGAAWASGGLSVLLAWSLGLSRSNRELSFVSRVAMAFVLLASGSAALGDVGAEGSGGERKLRRAAKASSVLLLLLLLGQHSG